MKKKYYLNFTDLSEETQDKLIQDAIIDLEDEYEKEELEKEAQDINVDYDIYIREKAEEHMYTFNFEFNI